MTVARIRRLWMLSIMTGTSVTLLSLTAQSAAQAQQVNPQPSSKPQPSKTVFPDEFSDLDEGSSTSGQWDKGLVDQLEKARQRYLKALSLVEQKDTALAAQQFELAIVLLNDLASYPRIEENADFTDLAQSVIEDYESYVQNIDQLDENSSVFILRERLFEEVDKTRAPGMVETIAVPKVQVPSIVPNTVIPLPINEHVEKHITLLTSPKGRKFMKKWLERSGRWFDLLKRVAKEENMPEEIVYLAMMESGLNPNAVSWAKAVGMWQFMQPTGLDYDLNVSFWVDERRDPEKATRAAMQFLKDLYRDLGDWHLALAAYNCGAGGVKRAMRKAGVVNGTFWDIQPQLPRETRNYVPLYIATTLVTLNREQYGFTDDSLSFHPTYEYDLYMVPEPTNLSALARCADLTLDSLKQLNPELVRTCTPPGSDAYPLKIPKGTLENVQRRYAALTDEEKRPWMTHTVSKGETLASIARRYGVSSNDISSVNQLRGYQSKLRRGTTLRIPIGGGGDRQLAANDQRSTTTTATRPDKDMTSSRVPAVDSSADPASTTQSTARRNSVTHVVVNGDNLYSVARRYGVRLTDLRNWNNIPYDRENIHIGDTLIVAVTDEATRPTSTASVEKIRVTRTVQHNVARGESLASIATLYGTSVERIRDLNRMTKRATIKVGSNIKVETSLGKNEVAAITRSAPTGKAVTHKVRKGENLSGIAALYGVDETDLRRWNADVVEGRTVFAGTRLKVYGGTQLSKGSSSTSSAKRLPKTYKVRRGDSLSSIADKFGVSVDILRSKNRSLRASDIVRSGQIIRLQ